MEQLTSALVDTMRSYGFAVVDSALVSVKTSEEDETRPECRFVDLNGGSLSSGTGHVSELKD